MTPRCAKVLAIAIATAWATSASAEPSYWDAVRDPKLAKAEQVLRVASRSRSPREIPHGFDATFDALLDLRAAIMIELAGGPQLPGADIAFFLGDALIGARAGREAEGREVLRAALAAHPDHPLASRAWFSIAIASNMLRDAAGELAAYDHALALEWNPEMRSRIHLNRGESRMLEGRLRDAERDYETSLSLAASSEGYALAHWGLAVTLVRSGDLPGALEHAHDAASLRFAGPGDQMISAVDLPGVFFTPAHEIHYYRALGFMGLGQRLRAADAAAHFEQALAHWDAYIREARASGDRWLEGAEHQRAWCQRRLERARAGDAEPIKRPAASRARPREAG